MIADCLYVVLMDDARQAGATVDWMVAGAGVAAGAIASFTPALGPPATRFNEAASWLDNNIERLSVIDDYPRVVIVADLPPGTSISELNPAGQEPWGSVLGMLVLAYPEVHWIFFNSGVEEVAHGASVSARTRSRLSQNFATGPTELVALLRLVRGSPPPLFDGTGLRNIVRRSFALSDESARAVVLRKSVAVAVDEERPYAWLHAYVAYRFGYLADAVSTLRGMERLSALSSPPALVLEDVRIEFPDDDEKRMAIPQRYRHFPWLRAPKHFYVTSAAGSHEPVRRTDQRGGTAREEASKTLAKPVAGIFQLGQEANLRTDRGFVRLARERAIGPAADDDHAAHHRILPVVERLVDKARKMVSACNTVQRSCYGAVLSTDAFELLAERTPTLAFEALSLKHQFEVLAECQFIGVRHHVNANDRMEEISANVRQLLQRSRGLGDNFAIGLNTEISIVGSVLDILRRHNRFDEEQCVLARMRALNRNIFIRSKIWPEAGRERSVGAVVRFITNWLTSPIWLPSALYLVWIIGRPLRFFIGIVAWMAILGLAFAVAARSDMSCVPLEAAFGASWRSGSLDPLVGSYLRGLSEAITTFLSVQPANDSCVWKDGKGVTWGFGVVITAMGLGFAHLGILISYAYSLLSRR